MLQDNDWHDTADSLTWFTSQPALASWLSAGYDAAGSAGLQLERAHAVRIEVARAAATLRVMRFRPLSTLLAVLAANGVPAQPAPPMIAIGRSAWPSM